MFKEFGTKLSLGTTNHPQKDGKTKRVKEIIEDMLRMHAMERPTKWEVYLYLVEFSYKNGYYAYLKMSPFATLNGRDCNVLVN